MEFEQGIPPPDPWDQPKTLADDIRDLESVLTENKKTSPPPPSYQADFSSLATKVANISVREERRPPLPVKPQDVKTKIMNMGYSEQAAKAAIKAFGESHSNLSQLLKFSAFFDKVKLNRYAVEDVVMAFNLFPEDSEKAASFLCDFSELKEFGFPSSRIKDALVKAKHDKNLALDILMEN